MTVSDLLDVGSVFKDLLSFLLPGPLDKLSHWIRQQAQVAVLLFPVVTSKHAEADAYSHTGSARLSNGNNDCIS